MERLPFSIAIKEPKLLKPRFDSLSMPQQVALKAFYGLPLGEAELVMWSIFQGGATYDKLGYPTAVTLVPYLPKEYDTMNLYVGRRSGKTDKIISTGVAYEITLGGHEQYVRPGQQLKVPFIAQTADDAKQNMSFIRLALEDSPLLAKQLLPDQVASEIRLRSGLIVDPLPANKAVGRGHAIPVWVGDEIAFWYTDTTAANPDYEVIRAIQYAQLQFPNAKQFLGTTPWAEQGVAWDNYKAGTEGRKLQCEVCRGKKEFICEHPVDDREEFDGMLVLHASTAAMQNPLISRKKLVQIQKKDPEAFARESLAQTLKSVSGWLNHDKIQDAIMVGETHLEKRPRKDHPNDSIPVYVAALDPAFRKDSFAFTIVHHDAKLGIVQDYSQYWTPLPGIPLKPGLILDEVKAKLTEYGLESTYSDQHQLESLQELAMDRGFMINGYDFTGPSKGKIAGGFKISLDQGRIKLLDIPEQTLQFQQLQRKVTQMGNVQISAPPGKHDDLAMVMMLAARIVMWQYAEEAPKPEPVKTVDTDHKAMVLEQIERKREEALRADEDW